MIQDGSILQNSLSSYAWLTDSAVERCRAELIRRQSQEQWNRRQRIYLDAPEGTPGAASRELRAAHRDVSRGRVIRGANRSGKSTWGAYEMVWLLTGTHPYRRAVGVDCPQVPCYARVVCPELPLTLDRGHPQRDLLRDVVPEHLLRGGSWAEAWNSMARTLWLSNGSSVELVSSQQPPIAHAGMSRIGVVWIDEECPREHYTESLRGMDTPGACWYLTYYPGQSVRWIREFHDAVQAGHVPGVTLHTVRMADNAHNLPPDYPDWLRATLTDEMIRSRVEGEYAESEDLVFGGIGFDRV